MNATFSRYKTTSYYTLDPNLRGGDSGVIPISEIATRVYGKRYNSLRGCQADNEHLPNGSVSLYHFDDVEDFEEALDEFDETRLYLGWDEGNRRAVYKTGMTQLEYWLTITVSDRPENATVEANPPDHADLEGAAFESAFFADRAFTPSLGGVIADLIRRGELPRGNYLYRHYW